MTENLDPPTRAGSLDKERSENEASLTRDDDLAGYAMQEKEPDRRCGVQPEREETAESENISIMKLCVLLAAVFSSAFLMALNGSVVATVSIRAPAKADLKPSC